MVFEGISRRSCVAYMLEERYLGLRKHKLLPRSEGPYEIVEKISDITCKLNLKESFTQDQR